MAIDLIMKHIERFLIYCSTLKKDQDDDSSSSPTELLSDHSLINGHGDPYYESKELQRRGSSDSDCGSLVASR